MQGFYSPKQVKTLTTLSPVTIWRMRRRNNFPKPVKISPGRIGYPKEAIDDWIAQRVKQHDQHAHSKTSLVETK